MCRFPGMSESEESSVVIFRATNPGGRSEQFCDWKRVFFSGKRISIFSSTHRERFNEPLDVS